MRMTRRIVAAWLLCGCLAFLDAPDAGHAAWRRVLEEEPARSEPPSTSAAPAAQSQSADPIEDVIVAAGLRRDFASFGTQLSQRLDRLPNEGHPERMAMLREAAQYAFSPDRLVAVEERELRQRLQPADAAQVAAWYRSPQSASFKHVADSESPDPAALRVFASQLQTQPPTTIRTGLMERLDETMGVTDGIMESMRMMTKGLLANAPPSESGQADALIGEMSSHRDDLRNTVRIRLLFACRQFSNDQLETYLQFWSSPSAQHYLKAQREAFGVAIREGMRRFVDRVGQSQRMVPTQ